MCPACVNMREPGVVSMLLRIFFCLWTMIHSVGHKNHLIARQWCQEYQKPLPFFYTPNSVESFWQFCDWWQWYFLYCKSPPWENSSSTRLGSYWPGVTAPEESRKLLEEYVSPYWKRISFLPPQLWGKICIDIQKQLFCSVLLISVIYLPTFPIHFGPNIQLLREQWNADSVVSRWSA